MRRRSENASPLGRGWHLVRAATAVAVLSLMLGLMTVQAALRAVTAHSDLYFDVYVAKHLAPTASGTVSALVAGSGVPVEWHMAPFTGTITASWVIAERSELMLVGAGPLAASVALGWLVVVASRRLAVSRRHLLVASAAGYAGLTGLLQIATREPAGTSGMELTTSALGAVGAAACWALLAGGAVVRFHPSGAVPGPRRVVVAARRRGVRDVAVAVAVALVGSLVSAGPAVAAGERGQQWRPSGVREAVASLTREAGHDLVRAENRDTGTPSMLTGLRSKVSQDGVPGWLRRHARVFGVADTTGMLKKDTERMEVKDPTGARHVWYDQAIDGVPVYGARLGVHLDRAGTTVTAVSNGLRPDLIAPESTDPVVSKDAAVKIAAKALPGGRSTVSPTLVVYPYRAQEGVRGSAFLTWQVDLADDSANEAQRFFVDALHGTIVGVQPLSETLDRTIRDMKHATSGEGEVVRTEGQPPVGDKDADDAYDQAEVVYSYYYDAFERVSLDNNDMALTMRVHQGTDWRNAQWNGSSMYMNFGDGMLSQDVTGHEMTHAVTQFTANLQYIFQSGALNESISDYFGEMTERAAKGTNDWLVGSDIAGGVPFRDMTNPGAFGQPQTMSQYVQTCSDNGGVHKNSGIPNYAFYRMASLIGPNTTAAILYRALTTYLTPVSTFADAHAAMVTAAKDLYPDRSTFAWVVDGVWTDDAGVDATTPDPKPESCAATCTLGVQVYGNADALKPGGADIDQVVGSLIHLYETGTVSPSPALAYYEDLYFDYREDFDATLRLDGDLLDRFVRLAQTWHPVLDALGTDRMGGVVLTQEQIDSANAFADAVVTAAKAQGKSELARVVTEQRGEFDPQHVVGMSVEDAQSYLDQVVDRIGREADVPGTAAPSLDATFDNVAVTSDDDTGAGDFDGGGASFSEQALATAGVVAGSRVAHSGVALSWPSTAGSGKPDNTLASGQTIAVTGTGDTLGFLVSASYGPAGGTGKVYYSDGSSQPYTLGSPDWFGGPGDVAVTTAYQNRQGNQTFQGPAYVYYVGVPLQAGKTPVSVRLPDVGSAADRRPALHVFAMGRGTAAPELSATFNNVAVTQDTLTNVGDIDGGGASFSAQALATAGVTAGSAVSHKGLAFTWPATAGASRAGLFQTRGVPDNTVSSGQTVAVDGTGGSTLGFLVSGSYGSSGGTATLNYSDGSTQSFALTSSDWFGGAGDVAITSGYQNRRDKTGYPAAAYVYYVGVPLQAGKTPVSVRLPSGPVTADHAPALHVFAMTRG